MRGFAGFSVALVLGGLVGCEPEAESGPDPVGRPAFSNCEATAEVSLDSVPTRQTHPEFSFLVPASLGDSLAAMDHAIVVDEQNSLHCFWTRGRDWAGGASLDFGHARTEDMIEWTVLPPVKLASPTHAIDRVFAPQLIREAGLWHMYFTGIEMRSQLDQNVQRIFVSRSTDLLSWSAAELVLEPIHESTRWGSGLPWGNDARDQMVFDHEGSMKMLLTVRLDEHEQGLALAERVAGTWRVMGVLDDVQGRVMESPYLYEHAGRLHLFVNNWLDRGQAVWTADRLLGPWTREDVEFRGFALEILQMDSDYLLSSRIWGSSILLSQIDLDSYRSTNMVYPECYDGSSPLLAPHDNLVRISRPLR